MSDPVSDLKRELLAAAERQQRHALSASRGRRRWLEHSDVPQDRRRRRLVALAVAVIVVAVGTASAIGSVRHFVVERGFLGLPPIGATPSSPESGELVLEWHARSASVASAVDSRGGERRYVGALVRVWVYADGRVIWDRREGRRRIPEGANEVSSGFLEQRLTPEGVELLRSKVVATGLFERSLALNVPQGDRPDFYGSADLHGDGRIVRLRWDSPLDSTTPSEGRTATPEQVSALQRLDALLSDPVSKLPSRAWADRQIRAYVPSHYAVCLSTSPPTGIARLLSLLPARAEELLRGRNWTRSEGEVVEALEGGRTKVLGRSVDYCSKFETEEAREVNDAVSGLDRARFWGPPPIGYVVAEAVDNLSPTTIAFQPYLPHGEFP